MESASTAAALSPSVERSLRDLGSRIVAIYLAIGLGYACARWGFLRHDTHNALRVLNGFVVRLGIPALCFSSACSVELTPELARLAGAEFAWTITAALACLLAARAYKLTQREAATLLSAAAVPNVIIIGLPLYEALFGADVLPYLLIAALPQILLVMPLLVLLYVCVPNISPTKGELLLSLLFTTLPYSNTFPHPRPALHPRPTPPHPKPTPPHLQVSAPPKPDDEWQLGSLELSSQGGLKQRSVMRPPALIVPPAVIVPTPTTPATIPSTTSSTRSTPQGTEVEGPVGVSVGVSVGASAGGSGGGSVGVSVGGSVGGSGGGSGGEAASRGGGAIRGCALARRLLLTPLLLATLAGLVANAFSIAPPQPLDEAIHMFGGATLALAFFSLGVATREEMRRFGWRAALLPTSPSTLFGLCLVRHLLAPASAVCMGLGFGLRHRELQVTHTTTPTPLIRPPPPLPLPHSPYPSPTPLTLPPPTHSTPPYTTPTNPSKPHTSCSSSLSGSASPSRSSRGRWRMNMGGR